jgi:hypothetical protein
MDFSILCYHPSIGTSPVRFWYNSRAVTETGEMDRTDEDWKRLFDQVTEQIKLEKKQSTNSEVQQIFPIAPYIDHTLLALDATPGQIDKICDEAKEFSFAVIHPLPQNEVISLNLIFVTGSLHSTKLCISRGRATPWHKYQRRHSHWFSRRNLPNGIQS